MGKRENILNELRAEMGSFQHQLMDEFKEIFLNKLSIKPNWRKEEIESEYDDSVTQFIAENILDYKGEKEANFGPVMGSFGEEYIGPERRGKKVLPPPAGFNRD